uniref:Uncharacterized protein n=1 Tax=Candidatus Enterococcus clewellii TaxID=1834193 RepID=A0A242K1F8_9ENTE|nr:hypothetical protein A5888_003589 [Enterococcus sp. 9E7_DIV0242]
MYLIGGSIWKKTDLSSAYRRLKSPNIKTRKRALKVIKEYKRSKPVSYTHLDVYKRKELINDLSSSHKKEKEFLS